MALVESLYKLADICADGGIKEVVIGPGSRSAALTLAFARHEKFRTHVITDERSAAFVALGIAQATGTPTVLICTSGTAALNFAPAVAEAFFQGTPLLVLTADRPVEWVHQYDGQTIFQQNIYGNHAVKSYTFPADYTHPDSLWMMERQMHEALFYCRKGPVHINVPIREPFYPEEGEVYLGGHKRIRHAEGQLQLDQEALQVLKQEWVQAKHILIAVGQNMEPFDELLGKLLSDGRVEVLADVISNVKVEGSISSHDLFLGGQRNVLPPDLLITFGRSFISKNLKQFFRKQKPKAHWHIDSEVGLLDPFQSITTKITSHAGSFLKELVTWKKQPHDEGCSDGWKGINTQAEEHIKVFIRACPFGEFKAMAMILSSLRSGDGLHLGNSMPVRYANYLGLCIGNGIKVFANRGTSGIEGVVSTALGQAYGCSGTLHCVVGDISFFYDSNALYAPLPENLRIYLIQNGGGNIFRLIDGPSRQPELERYFLTDQKRSAESICKERGMTYFEVRSEDDLEKALKHKEGEPALFEIYVNGAEDAAVLQRLKQGFTW